MKASKKNITCGWIYCFKRGAETVVLNRKDKVVATFNDYNEAVKWANNNL